MTTIAEVRELLAVAVRTGTGTRCDPYARDDVTAPCFQVDRAPMDPRFVFSEDTAVYRFRLHLYVKREAEIAAQKLIDEHCAMTGEKSVKQAVQDEDNWPGSIVQSVQLLEVGETVEAVRGESRFLMTTFTVEVVW